ncbi:MAG TPA: arylsulfotransferase family protein [Gemmatimonadales bacterium]|nr:arylsulfotransferase family protein [Gemmatimonadales bacterium]
MSLSHLHKALLFGALIVVLSSATLLSIASRRIDAEQAAFGAAPTVSRCEPDILNRSDLLPGTSLAVSPLPDSYDASPRTQISMLGAAAGAIASVTVTGSSTGAHSGRLRAYSQGDGASFVPSRPFTPGESVVVRGTLRSGKHRQRFAYRFVVSHPDAGLYQAPMTVPKENAKELQHFHSAPTLKAPQLQVAVRTEQASSGYLFAAPYSGPGPAGPIIFDDEGNLVWFHPLPAQLAAANLQVQPYGPEQVLTWWQGRVTPQGFGEGEEVIENQAYHEIGRVHAGNGYKADLHDFHITPRGTAQLTAFAPVECDLSALGGPRHAAVTNTATQEIDLATGLVRREWTSLDHIGLAESYSTATHSSTAWPFDYFHVNSIDQLANGRTLLSARNTWGLYELNTITGQVLTRIGGKHSSVKLAAGAETAFQHDASVLSNGTISVFDNGGVPAVHRQSRALLLAVNPQTRTDSVVAQFVHPKPLSSGSQGNAQPLPNGNLFIGWGAQPYFSEFSASSNQLVYDAHWHGSYQSYRAYRLNWTGAPPQGPALAVAAAHGGALTAYVSWNGDTRTASWRLLAGSSTHNLQPVAAAARAGFETAIAVPGKPRYLAVQALDADGNVLAGSGTIAP